MEPQRRGRLQPHAFGNAIDRVVRGFEPVLREKEPLVDEPPVGRRAGLRTKLSREAPRRHTRLDREGVDGQGAVEVRLRPVQQARQAMGRVILDRRRHELRLTAFPMRGHDKPFRDEVRDRRAEVLADDMKAEVDARGAARGCQDTSFVDVEYVRLDHDFRKPRDEARVPGDNGLGDGEDRLELVEDMPSVCLACSGAGRQRIGFGDHTEPCDHCAGSGRLQ